MNDGRDDFVETLEYRRFVEFCDSCRHYRYIGLCYGPPGTGKTLSARRYSRVAKIEQHRAWNAEPLYGPPLDTVFYAPGVVNTPQVVAHEIARGREGLLAMARGPLRRQANYELDTIRLRDQRYHRENKGQPGYEPFQEPPLEPSYQQVQQEYENKIRAIENPTTLLLVDEADRLRMSSLEQVRAIFDEGRFGVVLIGMPGIEKRMARYPQFYSRIGFVHEFRPLGPAEMGRLFDARWAPSGVKLPNATLSADVSAAIMRVTGGNFRLLNRLLTQIERILEINQLQVISPEVVEAARESLVIGRI
jgi:DNA transposition AAA+ family ATPase